MMFKALPVALLAAVAAAQDFGNVPSCANSCIDAAFSESGCSSKDNLACLCISSPYVQSIANCLLTSCSEAQQSQTWTAIDSTCAEVIAP